MSNFSVRKKPDSKLWWMEEGEVRDSDKRLNEAYGQKNFKAGWDGKNAPSAVKMGTGYAKDGDGKFDKLGSTSGTKTTKGAIEKKVPTVKEKQVVAKKPVYEAFEDEDFDDEQDFGGEGEGDFDNQDGDYDQDDFGGDDDFDDDGMPPEMEDGGEGEVAENTVVEIEGKRYSLVPMEDEMGGEGEGFEGEDDFGGDEGFEGEDEDMDADEFGGVASEDKDLTHKRESKKPAKKRSMKEDEGAMDNTTGDTSGTSNVDSLGSDAAFEESFKKAVLATKGSKKVLTREGLIKKYSMIKKIAEKKLLELFTGEYVMNKQGETGFDFTDVGGDDSFAIIDAAHTGKQYTPTISKSVYEPGADKKGGYTGNAKTVEKKATSRKPIVEDEDNPTEAFNKRDSEQDYEGEDFVALPEILGKEPNQISQYNKTVEARKGRRDQDLREKVASAVSPKGKMKESFNFKSFLSGSYGK